MYKTVEELAHKKGVTMEEVAKANYIAWGLMNLWKYRGVPVNEIMLKRLEDYFGVPYGYIKTGGDKDRKDAR